MCLVFYITTIGMRRKVFPETTPIRSLTPFICVRADVSIGDAIGLFVVLTHLMDILFLLWNYRRRFLGIFGPLVFALLVFVVLFTALLNFLMPSHAAKLAFMGPVLVPLFMMFNVSPEATYLAYRIGDSVTNAITPMMGYFVLILAWAQRYKKDVGMGTLISNLLPYSVWYLVTYLVLMAVWYFLGLPLGPGVGFAYGLG